MNQPVAITPAAVRDLLLDALNATTTRDEQDAWDAIIGQTPFWVHAVNYCTTRRIDLNAIGRGYDKSGASVLAILDVLRGRATGPREPEVHPIQNTRAIAWVWRTSDGPRPFVMERAEVVDGYAPDQWRQGKITKLESGELLLDLSDGVTAKWSIPKTGDAAKEPVLGFDDRLNTPCHQPGCESDSIAECGHPAMADVLGSDLPAYMTDPAHDPGPGRVRCGPCSDKQNDATEVLHVPPACDDPTAGPCEGCGKPHCREDAVAVCRSPGCDWNPDTRHVCAVCSVPVRGAGYCSQHHPDAPLEYPDGSPEHRAATAQLGKTVFTWWCSVCEGADPESGEVPNSGHHHLCPLATENLGVPPCDHAHVCDDVHEGPCVDACPCPPECPCHPCPGECNTLGGHKGGCTADCFTSLEDADAQTESGIPPNALCWCGHQGFAHDHRTKACVQCEGCAEFATEQDVDADDATESALHWCECGHEAKQHGRKACAQCGGCNGFVDRDATPPVDALASARANMADAVEKCACGHASATHSRPSDECSACPCISFRPGDVVPLVSPQGEAAYTRRLHREFMESIDADKTRKQRVAKLYRQCKLCKKPIMQKEQWIAPKDKVKPRVHVACYNEAAKKLGLVLA